jgi:predicted dehydrogenase
MSKTIRVGIIGTGGIARSCHIPGYQKLADVEIVALCDVAPGLAAKVAAELGVPHAFEDAREMFAQVELDAVSVCTPNVSHREMTVLALEAGAHVLCEKPIAMNLQEGQAMVAKAKATDKVLQIGLHYRFTPAAQTVKRFVEAGELGDIYYGESTYFRRRGIPSWGVFTQKKLQGGGAMIDIGVHVLDHTLWLMGNPKPVGVFGSTYAALGNQEGLFSPWGPWDTKKFDVDDMAVAMIKFDTGATLILRSCWAGHIEKTFEEMRLMGTKGGAFMHPLGIYKDVHGVMVDITPKDLPKVEPHAAEIAHFIACIRGEVSNVVVPEQVLDVQAIIDAVYQSAKSGHEVVL